CCTTSSGDWPLEYTSSHGPVLGNSRVGSVNGLVFACDREGSQMQRSFDQMQLVSRRGTRIATVGLQGAYFFTEVANDLCGRKYIHAKPGCSPCRPSRACISASRGGNKGNRIPDLAIEGAADFVQCFRNRGARRNRLKDFPFGFQHILAFDLRAGRQPGNFPFLVRARMRFIHVGSPLSILNSGRLPYQSSRDWDPLGKNESRSRDRSCAGSWLSYRREPCPLRIVGFRSCRHHADSSQFLC